MLDYKEDKRIDFAMVWISGEIIILIIIIIIIILLLLLLLLLLSIDLQS